MARNLGNDYVRVNNYIKHSGAYQFNPAQWGTILYLAQCTEGSERKIAVSTSNHIGNTTELPNLGILTNNIYTESG